MFTINSESDYGLIILSGLLKNKSYMPLSDLVEKTNLPRRYLARIASVLVRRGLLTSQEGRDGGYKVTAKVKTMNLFEYLTVFEKNIKPSKCCTKAFNCPFENVCKHGKFFQHHLNGVLSKQLKNIRLTEMFKS